MKKPKCKHRPVIEVTCPVKASTIYAGKLSWVFFGNGRWVCEKCGKPVKAIWREG